MDPKFVNLLIQQLLNTTKCPKCGSPISPINVKVESIGKENCLFKMQCAKCKTVISADAQMAQHNQSNLKKMKKADPVLKQKTLVKPKKTKPELVNLDDLMRMKKTLNNFSGSFNSFFQC